MHNLKTLFLSLLLCGSVVMPAHAVLKEGTEAPVFSINAVLGGKPFTFMLGDALRKGPVVLYFYPKAYTSGCTVEAHLFSDAADSFEALHATVLGVSSDNLETVTRFSVEECHSKFAVAADPQGRVIDLYDAHLLPLSHIASRISYVITPDHKVYFVYKAMSPDDHVKKTLEAIKEWTDKKPKY
jgi:peroxiredoxin